MAKSTDKTTKPSAKKTGKKAADTSRRLIGENTTFTVTIPWKQVEKAQAEALQHKQQHTKLEGFRLGKAPLSLVAQNLGKTGLRDLTLEHVLPDTYRKGLQEHNYLPLADPEVRLDSIEDQQDWVVSFIVALPPEIKLEGYEKIVAATKAKHEAWKSASTEAPDDKAAQEIRNRQINAIIEALLEKIEVVIPEQLLRSEARRRLDDLNKQLEQMQMSVEDYLQRTNRTMEQLQQDVAAQSLLSLQVELLLAALIRHAKLTVDHDLVHQALPHDRQFTQAEHDYAESMLLKQRAVDHLLAL